MQQSIGTLRSNWRRKLHSTLGRAAGLSWNLKLKLPRHFQPGCGDQIRLLSRDLRSCLGSAQEAHSEAHRRAHLKLRITAALLSVSKTKPDQAERKIHCD